MESPSKKLIDWYKSLPISHRQDIGAFIGQLCPGFNEIDPIMDFGIITEKVVSAIESKCSSNFKEVAVILCLRDFIRVFFIDKRSEKNGWKETESMLNQLAAENKSETFEKMATEVEFKAQQWPVSCEKWNILVKESLSNEKLKSLLI